MNTLKITITPNTDGPSAKPRMPDVFNGDQTGLNTWLLNLEIYFKLKESEIADNEKVLFASSLMKKEAEEWV